MTKSTWGQLLRAVLMPTQLQITVGWMLKVEIQQTPRLSRYGTVDNINALHGTELAVLQCQLTLRPTVRK